MKLFSFGLMGTAVLAASVRVAAWGGTMVVYTPSVPMGLYWRSEVDARQLVRGAYVCLNATSRRAPEVLRDGVWSGALPRAWAREPLVKRIAGVAGDRVQYVPGEGVVVNGRVLDRSIVQETDSQGRALPFPAYPLVLRLGQVWLTSEHEDGFDSRYFGAVDTGALGCVAEPVWTR